MTGPLRVLFASMKWDYGFQERGLSFEHANMYSAMEAMPGVEVRHLDFMEAFKAGGHAEVRRQVMAAVEDLDPQMLFTVLFEDQFPKDLLAELRDRPGITTFNWFADDHWRFDNFTKNYAPLFNACSTTSQGALAKYAAIGYTSVVKTQWACNHHLYRPTGRPASHGVTFVGQPHGNRREVIDGLRVQGVEVETWGQGWGSGRLEQEDMIACFAESRINLNLSNSSVSFGPLASKIVYHGRPRRFFSATAPIGRRLGKKRLGDQIKGRNFEIPGCGGFQLSGHSEDLERYYSPDEEIAIFRSEEELLEQVHRYLRDDTARERIAAAGYRRTLAEHTYEHRYRAIFQEVGLL